MSLFMSEISFYNHSLWQDTCNRCVLVYVQKISKYYMIGFWYNENNSSWYWNPLSNWLTNYKSLQSSRLFLRNKGYLCLKFHEQQPCVKIHFWWILQFIIKWQLKHNYCAIYNALYFVHVKQITDDSLFYAST